MRIGFSSIMLKRTWVKYSPVLSVDESEMILFFIFKITFKITIWFKTDGHTKYK